MTGQMSDRYAPRAAQPPADGEWRWSGHATTAPEHRTAQLDAGPAERMLPTFRRPRPFASALSWVERGLAFVALATLAGALGGVMRLGAAALGGRGVHDGAVLAALWLAFAAMLAVRPMLPIDAALRQVPTALLTLLALASALWSEAPRVSLTRGFALLGLTAFALFLVTQFTRRATLVLLAWPLALVAVHSLLLVLASPDRGMADRSHPGAWTGIYTHKNALGLLMALGVTIFVALALSSVRLRAVAWVGTALCAILVIFSQSTTSLLVTAASVGVYPLVYVARRHPPTFLLLATAGLMLAGGTAVVWPSLLDRAIVALGEDPTLSGRVPLWGFLLTRLAERPLLGYGYSGFWLGWAGPSASIGDVTGEWYPWHAQNGFLELALGLGGVGLALFLIGYAGVLAQALRSARADGAIGERAWPLSFLVFYTLVNCTESPILQHNGLLWLVYLTVAFGATVADEPGAADATGDYAHGPGGAGRRVGVTLGARRALRRAAAGERPFWRSRRG